MIRCWPQVMVRGIRRSAHVSEPAASLTNNHTISTRIQNLAFQDRLKSHFIACSTKLMLWFSVCHIGLQRIGDHPGPKLNKLVALLVCLPCFKASHFIFKVVYTLQQRKLLRLCREDFLLEIYNRAVSRGSIMDVLQSLPYQTRS